LASRILALYWASWALSEMTYMPERVLSLSHYTGQLDGYSLYMHNQYSTIIASLVVRIIALSIAALAFWSCGPKVARLFLAPAGIENPA
jgi:uncharacterized membrane protein